MAYFSKFDGDENVELYELQTSVLHESGYDSAISLFLRESISRYKACMHIIELHDEITRMIDHGCPYKHYNFSEFIEIIAAYYRFIWGCQYYLQFPEFNIPKTNIEKITHYKKFLFQEGKLLSENYDFFPSIIHLVAVQGFPYFFDLKKHLLLILSNFYRDRVYRLYERELTFVKTEQLKRLKNHEYNFIELKRDQILELIEKHKTVNEDKIG